jgi:hypothetical protein
MSDRLGLSQNKWGPAAWFMLHSSTFNYPIKPTEKDKEDYYNFFMSLKNILPCGYCRKNYERNLAENPIKLNCRKDLVCWLIDIHNEVNGKEGKRHYSYEEVMKIYETKLGKKIPLTNENETLDFTCDKHCSKSIIIIIIIVLLLMIILYCTKKYYIKLFSKLK